TSTLTKTTTPRLRNGRESDRVLTSLLFGNDRLPRRPAPFEREHRLKTLEHQDRRVAWPRLFRSGRSLHPSGLFAKAPHRDCTLRPTSQAAFARPTGNA